MEDLDWLIQFSYLKSTIFVQVPGIKGDNTLI